MTRKLFQSRWAKEGKELSLLNPNRASLYLFYLLVILLPTQLGLHFWPVSSYINGLRIDYLSPTLYLTDILITLIFLLNLRIFPSFIKQHKRKLLIYLIFVLFLGFGVVFAKNPLVGFLGIAKLLEFSFLGFYIYLNRKSISLRSICLLFSGGLIFETVLAIVQYFNQGSVQGLLYFFGERSYNSSTPGIANASIDGKLVLRSYGTFSHPNVLGGYLSVAIAASVLFSKKMDKKIMLLVAFGVIGVFISFSRTAAASLALFVFAFFLISIYEKYKKGKLNNEFVIKKLFIILTLVLTATLFSYSTFFQRFVKLDLQDESISMRAGLASQSIKMIVKNPVFGVGVSNYLNNLEKEFNTPALVQPVHNIFLLTFAEAGIIGLLALIFILIKAAQKNPYNILLLSVITVLGFFDHYLFTLQQGQLIFTIIISLLISNKLSGKIY